MSGAVQVYAEQIGNLMMDALSAKKYYHFVRLMGRAASHITLECALQTHPQAAIICEEVHQQNKTLADIVDEVSRPLCAWIVYQLPFTPARSKFCTKFCNIWLSPRGQTLNILLPLCGRRLQTLWLAERRKERTTASS